MPGIIVGVDGSSQSRRALQWALSEAAARRAPLTVLSVRDDGAVTCTAGDLTQDQAAEEVQELVDQAVSSQSGPAPPVTVQVIPGAGSASSQVACDAACPVVVTVQPLAAVRAGGARPGPPSAGGS